MNRIIILFILIIILGCNSQKSELEFEKEVFNDIFPELIDSTFFDFRLLSPSKTIPPPPNGIIISDSLNRENLKRHKKFLEEFEERKLKIENDTSRIVLAIVDTIFSLNQKNFERLDKKFKNDSLKNKTDYKINLSQFKNNKKFLFKYYSEFPKGRKIWKTEYPFHLGAVLSFSRIYFDRDKKNGVIESGTSFGILNGNGFRIFIKKIAGKWKIEKIEGTWIS
ncbi:hypothetical protein [Polaribacter sp. R77954]|uniref:hypothetical protein n=1 Tax=Polaribacter sp. R77954 TaxID=3093870 RepID=UPI0037C9DB45